MKFGVSLLGLAQQPRDEDMSHRLEELIEWVHAARDGGFDYLTIGQHYLTDPFQQFQPLPLLARLVPESGDMGLVATLVAPLHNPVDLAESWASLDVISGGRVTLSFALGYRDDEYAAFGVDPKERVRRQIDLVETLRLLWTQPEVTAQGLGFRLHRQTVTLRPLQRPHPAIWIAANADAAIARAARWGLPWNINPHARYETVTQQVAHYRQVAAEAGHPEPTFPMARELFCAPTREQAVATAEPFLAGKYGAYDRWGQDKALPGEEDFEIPFGQLASDRFVLGDPDDCAREIARYRSLGVDRLHLRMNWPGMPLDVALDGLRLFAREVAPRFTTEA
jgi:alkanesulfonate monooxygenase SsuD/methylene tetrahydromethanopterin reductase-like flavin-dependent oxidoreductase (luciferase family)